MIFLILWIIAIWAGAFIAQIVPEQFIYITGFTAGSISFAFLRLFSDFKK